MSTEEKNETVVAVRELLKASRESMQKGQAGDSKAKLAEAETLIEAESGDTPAVNEAKAAVYAELALLNQRLRDARAAIDYYGKSEAAARLLPTEGEIGDRYRLMLATTLINMTGLLAQQRLLDEGLEKSTEALSIVDGLTGKAGQAANMLRVGALQNQSSLLLAKRQVPEAKAALERCVELGAELVNGGNAQLLPQVVEASGRLVSVHRMLNDIDSAAAVAERAGRWAEAAYNGGMQMAGQLYVGTQLQLVDVRAGQGQFDAAEDHLWKAIEIGGDPRTLTIATGFYFSIARLPDAKLEEGGLPRAEVKDAAEELLGKVDGAQAPKELSDLLRARFNALFDDDVASAAALADGVEASGSKFPAVAQLLPLVRNDIEWVKAGRPEPKPKAPNPGV